MFWGHDATWWGIALAIVAIVLIIPGGLFTNFLTALIQNRAARWLHTAPLTMIAKLEKHQLEFEKAGEPLGEAEDWILRGVQCACKLVSFTVSMIGVIAMIGASIIYRTGLPPDRIPQTALLALIGIVTYLLTLIWNRTYIKKLDQLLRVRSPIYRKALHDEIESWRQRARDQGHKV